MTTIEKRKHPRVRTGFPLRLGPLASADVRDISLAGVRCVTTAPLVPMTRVALRLEIPTGGDGEDDWVEVPCEGVVVRSGVTEEDGEPRHEAAILFQSLGDAEREILSSFIQRRLNS